jgi:hypothetical protein
LYIFIGKEGQAAHVLDGSTAKSFHFSMIRPAAAAQMHADELAERLRADGITAMVALRSGTAEYATIRNCLSDRNYGQGKEQENVQGNTEEDDVQGNTKEDDAQDIDDKNNSPTALNAILPLMTRSTTRAAVLQDPGFLLQSTWAIIFPKLVALENLATPAILGRMRKRGHLTASHTRC